MLATCNENDICSGTRELRAEISAGAPGSKDHNAHRLS
jgi:hypothetical protein